MTKILITIFLGVSLSLIGCAYFNTYYNARLYYNRAAKSTEKNKTGNSSGEEQTNYQKAVDKALLLLENYPNSKWADDALLLLGKSYYYLRDYPSSERRLNELISDYPGSELMREAKFWLAKTKVSTSRFQEAENDLKTLIAQNISKKEKGEIFFYQAKLYDGRKDYEKAIENYQQALNADAKTWGASAWFCIGSDYDSLGIFEKCSAAFRQVLKYNPDPELAFNAQLRLARSEKELGRFDDAVRILEKLMGDEKNKSKVPILRLEIADCLALKGDAGGAIITYQDIIQLNPKTDYSAEAYYWLGDLYETQRKDYDRALDSFSNVKKESMRSSFGDSAEVKGRDILRLKALKQVVGMALRGERGEAVAVGNLAEEDTLNKAPRDTIRNLDRQKPDSTLIINTAQVLNESTRREGAPLPYQNKPPEPKIAENPELKTFKKEELDKNLFLLSELYLFRFHIPDSALSNYQLLVQKFPNSSYTPQALYNMGYIYDTSMLDSIRADSCYHKLVDHYPDSPCAMGVLKRLKLERIASQEDSISQIFQKAEMAFFEAKNPQQAAREYLNAWKRFPKTRLAAKALYSAGWINENALDRPDQAFALYDSLIVRYPESTFAQKVKNKVEAVKTEKSKSVLAERKDTGQKPEMPQIMQPVKTADRPVSTAADSSKTWVQPDTAKDRGKNLPGPEMEDHIIPLDTTGKAIPRRNPKKPNIKAD